MNVRPATSVYRPLTLPESSARRSTAAKSPAPERSPDPGPKSCAVAGQGAQVGVGDVGLDEQGSSVPPEGDVVTTGTGPPPARRPTGVEGVAEDRQQGGEKLVPGAGEMEDDLEI